MTVEMAEDSKDALPHLTVDFNPYYTTFIIILLSRAVYIIASFFVCLQRKVKALETRSISGNSKRTPSIHSYIYVDHPFKPQIIIGPTLRELSSLKLFEIEGNVGSFGWFG